MNRELPLLSDRQLFLLAMTHRSYVNEHPEIKEHNERLEFLGDAVLGCVIGEMLYKLYPSINEAQLTYLRSRLVDEKQLGKIGAELGLGKLMRLGKGAEKEGGRTNPSLLNDTFEAMIGAYFLERDINTVRSYLIPIFQPIAEQLVKEALVLDRQKSDSENTKIDNRLVSPQSRFIDSKNRLQQWALLHHQTTPTYKIIAETGPDHAKQFTAEVAIAGEVYGVGTGRRKQEAEKRAAESALLKCE